MAGRSKMKTHTGAVVIITLLIIIMLACSRRPDLAILF